MGRRKLEEEQVLEVRERMTRAAVALFEQGGLEAVTFRELGQALGVSHVTPYRYFHSKEDLVAAVRTAVFVDFDEFLRRHDRPRARFTIRLHSLWQGLLVFAQQRPQDYRLLFGLALPNDNDYLPLRAARSRTLEFICGLYADGVARGELHGDPGVNVQLMFSAAHGLISLHLAGQLAEASLPVDALLTRMISALLTAADVQAPAAAAARQSTTRQATPQGDG